LEERTVPTTTFPDSQAPHQHPRILAPFASEQVAVERESLRVPTIVDGKAAEEELGFLYRHFSIQCGHCSAGRFVILQRRRNSIDAIGDAIVGLTLRCSLCSAESSVFDARTDGYDGALGHNASLAGTARVEPLVGPTGKFLPPARVKVVLTYQGDGYLTVAEEDGIPAVDLFDWIEVKALLNDEWTAVWDYECA
jgi:hypothetical protein